MTQLMLDFGFSTSVCVPAAVVNRVTSFVAEPAAELSQPTTTSNRSLSLYDSQRRELKQIGDLAQLVVARYDIVRRRREARLQREALRSAK